MERVLGLGLMISALIGFPVNAQVNPDKACTLLGASNAGSEQQIRVYPGPAFENWNGSYGIPNEEVGFRDYVNNEDEGEEWFQVFFPGSGTEYWVIRYHIDCATDLWNN